MLIAISVVVVGAGRRPTTKTVVDTLAASIARIGLMTPITVLAADADGRYRLVAGRHRLAACRKLGHTEIEARVVKDKVTAELWHIAENLHRSDLTALQRSIAIGRWIKLTAKQIVKREKGKLRQPGAVSSGGRGLKGGVRAAARELGISETSARRAVVVADGLTPEAQKAAERLGLDKDLHALEQVAGSDRDYQVWLLEQEAASKQRKRAAKKAVIPQPKPTPKQRFDAWLASLEIDERMEVRIWLLGADLEKEFAEMDSAAERMALDRKALH